MSNIDNRLREIIIENASDDVEGFPKFIEAEIAQIKQLFAEGGYVCLKGSGGFSVQTDTGEPLMTGQEFYDRFVKELDNIQPIKGSTLSAIPSDGRHIFIAGWVDAEVREAAKRAANTEA